MNGFYRLYYEKTDRCYLSPKLFRYLFQRNHLPKVDYYKSDVFSMGMVILEAATLNSVQDCYNFQNGTININELNGRLK